jgi:hypothetical protein
MKDSLPRGRRFQLSLRTLFVLVLVVAAYFAELVTVQRRAEKAIHRRGKAS